MGRQSERLKFVLAGNGPYSNRGCEAIVRGTTAVIREHAGACEFISNYFADEGCKDSEKETDRDIIHRPFPYLRRYTLPWIEERIMRKILRRPENVLRVARELNVSLGGANVVLMLGGDNLSLDYGRPDIFFEICRMAADRGVPVVIWGASVGPFSRDARYEAWAKEVLRDACLICARESESVSYLSGIGVEANVILAADPAFWLEPAECELPKEIDQVVEAGCIGLNLSPLLWSFMGGAGACGRVEGSFGAWVKVAAEVVHCILRQVGGRVLLVPHVTSVVGSIYTDDYLFLADVAKTVEEPERVFVLRPKLNAAQTKWVIGRTRAFAGARTHSTLASISSAVPTICIGYSMKARGIAKDSYGDLEFLVDARDLMSDPCVLCDRLVVLLRHENDIRARLTYMSGVFRERVENAVQNVLDIAKKSDASRH